MFKRVMILGACVALASWTADACIHKPRGYDAKLEEVAQQAIIVHHNGYENLILRVQYEFKDPAKARPKELAWVIPTPNTPVSYKVADPGIFKEALGLAFPRLNGGRRGRAKSLGGRNSQPKLNFLEKVTVGDYVIQPIKAQGEGADKALNTWLSKNGFGEVPTENMTYYIKRNWTFLAVKMKAPKGQAALAAKGAFKPLQIRFKSKDIVYPLKFSSHQGTFQVSLFIITSKPLAADHVFWETADSGFFVSPKQRDFSLGAIQQQQKQLHKLLTTLDKEESVPDKLYLTKLVGRDINSPSNMVKDWQRDFAVRIHGPNHQYTTLDRLKIGIEALKRAGSTAKISRDKRLFLNEMRRKINSIVLGNQDKEALTYLFDELGKVAQSNDHPFRGVRLGSILAGCEELPLKELRPLANLVAKNVGNRSQRMWDYDINIFLRTQGNPADQLCLEMLQSKYPGWHRFSIECIRMNQYSSQGRRKLTPTRIQSIILAMKNKDAICRYSAVRAIPYGAIPDELTAALKLRLNDRNDRVREQAEKVWAQKGHVLDLWDLLVKKIETGTTEQKIVAIQSMGRLPRDSVKAVPYLLKALNDKELRVRQKAAWTVGLFHNASEQSVPILTELLKDPAQSEMHASAISGLSYMGPKAKAAFPLMLARLDDEDPGIQRSARASLLYMGKDAADHLSHLMILYKDAGQGIKRHIAGILAVCGVKAAPHFIELLGSGNIDDRALAAAGIARAGIVNKDYVPGLMKLAQEEGTSTALGGRDVRKFAINALGRMKKEALVAAPLLEKYAARSKKDLGRSVHASFALWRIKGSTEGFFKVTTKALSMQTLEGKAKLRKKHREAAKDCIVYLKKMGEKAKVKELELLFLLKVDSQSWCHKLVIEALQKVSAGSPETVTHLESLRKDEKLGPLAKVALAEIQSRCSEK